MAVTTILERIDAVYSGEAVAPDELRVFMAGIQASHEHASKLFARYALLFVVSWTVCHAVGLELITEGSVVAFRLADAKSGLIAAPITLGMLSYLMLSKFTFAEFLLAGIERSYRHRLPTVYVQNLSQLVAFPTIFNIERNLLREGYEAKWLNRVTSMWIGVGAICLLFVPLAALVHVSYLLIRADIYTLPSECLAISSGVVLWLRGAAVLFLYGAIER